MHCRTAQGNMHSPLFHVAVQKQLTMLFPCKYTCETLMFLQVCNEAAHLHYSTAQGNTQFPLLSAALQNRLTAGSVSLHLHPCGHLLFVQACSDPTPTHCSTGQGKGIPHCLVLDGNTAHRRLVSAPKLQITANILIVTPP